MSKAREQAREGKDGTGSPENAAARKALEEIQRIEREAQARKQEQVAHLRQVADTIRTRIGELQAQLAQVEAAIKTITGKAQDTGRGPRTPRANHGDLRDRVVRWMAARAGQKFRATDLQREFPELAAVPAVSLFLKRAIAEGKVATERPGGPRSTVYFVPRNANISG